MCLLIVKGQVEFNSSILPSSSSNYQMDIDNFKNVFAVGYSKKPLKIKRSKFTI